MQKKDRGTFVYRLTRPIIKGFCKGILRCKYYGLENIPQDGPIVLAGTHTNLLDSLLLVSSTKRIVRFLAKKELWHGFWSFYFKNMGMISVDRSKKDSSVLLKAKEHLKQGHVIGIFPEGTTEKEKGIMIPFKIGAIKMAYDTNTEIIPFAINANYRFLSKNLKMIFGKPFKVKSNDLEKENKRLMKVIEDLRKEII